jgi:tetratricopeptide (TPR) repeat protein
MGNAWYGLALIAQNEQGKALALLNKEGFSTSGLKPANSAFYHEVLAQIYIDVKKWEKAKEELNKAVTDTKKKKDKARLYFILGQVHEELDEYSSAQMNYEKTLLSRPSNELSFQAKMKKALNAIKNGSSVLIARSDLLKMLEDVKYTEYKDQILYTLALMAEEQAEHDEAKQLLQRSIRESKKNRKQKGKSFLLLADINFEAKQYVSAQAAYDSAQKIINPLHPRMDEIKGRAKSLTELVTYLNQISSADSLSKICSLSPADQIKAMEKTREQLIEKEVLKRQEEARLAAERQAAALENAKEGAFWCYNKTQREKGYQEFISFWEDRPLKDNWRLNAKLSQMAAVKDERPDQSANPEEGEQDNSVEKAVASVDDLLLSLPCKDNEKMSKLTKGKEEGYYKAGLIYKEDLNDNSAAIAIWEKMVTNLPENEYTPLALYQIYRTWWNIEQLSDTRVKSCATCGSKYWGDEIKKRYPNSEWSRFVDDPNAKDEKEKKRQDELLAYEQVYQLYSRRQYPEAMTACNQVINQDTTNHLLCKYKILNAVCVGYVESMSGLNDMYKAALQSVISDCPGTEEATQAQNMLDAFNPKENKEPVTPKIENPAPAQAEAVYQMNEDVEHYFAIEIPLSTPNLNGFKIQVSDYVQKFYASSKLTVTGNMLDTQTQLLMTKTFKNLAEAKDFMTTFVSDVDDLKSLNEKGFNMFLISKPNYVQLFRAKDLEKYKDFYKQNYQ